MSSPLTTQGGQVVSGTPVGTANTVDVTIKQNAGGTVSPSFTWDAYTRNDTATTDVYEYRTGGTGGTIQATLTITYVDSTKAAEQDVVWT